MANYSTLSDAISAGITNMTATRNNSASDDGTDSVAGVSWFKFNGVAASTIYACGNSWIGFGASSEQLKVNRRDCIMYYIYRETGTIGEINFFKLRWQGYATFRYLTDVYAQKFEIFLLSTGQIYLNYFDVTTDATYIGINALVCGAETVTYAVEAGTPCEYTFTPSDATNGTGWSVASGQPILAKVYKSSGSAVYSASDIQAITDYASSEISWTAETPEGTAISVSAVCATSTPSDNDYQVCTNGGAIPGLSSSDNLSAKTLYIKVAMSTNDTSVTPSMTALSMILHNSDDGNIILLAFKDLKRFLNVEGNLTVAYNANTGNLAGEGGAVASFSRAFTPTDLVQKPDPNGPEHIEITGVSGDGDLIRVTHIDVQELEHIEISGVSATSTLTHINDL